MPDTSQAENLQGLYSLACPQCGQSEALLITATTEIRLTPEGSSDQGNHEWYQDNFCRCPACGMQGKIEDFTKGGNPQAEQIRQRAISLARAQHEREGEIEIDDNAKINDVGESGIYVQAWVWVLLPEREREGR